MALLKHPEMCLNGKGREGGLQNATEVMVKRWVLSSTLASFHAPPSPFSDLSLDLTRKEARAPRDPLEASPPGRAMQIVPALARVRRDGTDLGSQRAGPLWESDLETRVKSATKGVVKRVVKRSQLAS